MKVKSITIILAVVFLAFNGFAQTEDVSHVIYFPHVAGNADWETEICIINQSDQELTGTFELYDDRGNHLSDRDRLETIYGLGRCALIVGEAFSSPEDIRYIVFSTESSSVCGYTKFYKEGQCRIAVPAVKEINAGDIYIPHIASNDRWWTGLALVNTTDSPKTLDIEFSTGQTRQIEMAPGAHWSDSIKSLFDGVAQTDMESAVIKGGAGVIGLELFSGGKRLSGVLLKDETTDTLYFPHVAQPEKWWTGIAAYNPGNSEANLTVTPYAKSGEVLPLFSETIPAGGRYLGNAMRLRLPEGTEWFKIDSSEPLNGFELFGHSNGNQLAGYSTVRINCRAGIFPKLEDNGWTGIAFVNTSDAEANINLILCDDDGYKVSEESIALAGHEKRVDNPEDLFGGSISAGTYIKFSSDREVVGFQLNASADGMLLDALPALKRIDFAVSSEEENKYDPAKIEDEVVFAEGELEPIERKGWIHEYCKKYTDSSAVFNKGPITAIRIIQGDYIYGIQLYYGDSNAGTLYKGFPEESSYWGLANELWEIPSGQIVRIEGGFSRDNHYISQLQFFTDTGEKSQVFGNEENTETKFISVNAPEGSEGLRTISVWVNTKKHESLSRAVTGMAFHFGPPCFIEDITYDLDALTEASISKIPTSAAKQTLTNDTSVEQTSLYKDETTITNKKKLTFFQTFGYKFQSTLSVEIPGFGGGSISHELSLSAGAEQCYEDTYERKVTWELPVRVPPMTKIKAFSTVKQYSATIPFSYTLAWYRLVNGEKEIFKRTTLGGQYEGIEVKDLQHQFAEEPLE